MHRSGLVWLAIFAVIALMFLQLPPMMAKQDAVVHTYSALVEVDALARQKYVDRVKPDTLVDGAIRGMMLQLDPYSGYIAPQELPAFERRSQGAFDGVGVELGYRNGKSVVISPVEGGPAARHGILAGDILLAIDGVSLEHRSVFDVEELLVGPEGTTVSIDVLHPGDQEPTTVDITRDHVTIPTVRGFRHTGDQSWDYWIDRTERIAYVRVSSFRKATVPDFDAALRQLRMSGLKALIIDLRFDPGGLMTSAIAMADRFLDSGLILSTVNRRKAVNEYRATQPGSVTDIPIVVLINGSSASSAEIVAGSLQARGRARIVGQRSFGKGSVQHLIPLRGHGGAVKLTVAHYMLPDGRIIHRTSESTDSDNWGIIPDVTVTLDDDEVATVRALRMTLDASPSHDDAQLATLLATDRQLAEALSQTRKMIATGSVTVP